MFFNVIEVDGMPVAPERITHGKRSFSASSSPLLTARDTSEPFRHCRTIRTFGLWLLIGSCLTTPPTLLLTQTASSSSELAADLQRAQAALKSNDQATAMQEFRAVLKLDPANVEAHANLGVMAFFHGDCTAAEQEFHNVLRVAPSLIKAQALLAICERRLGQPSAQADMESAFAKLDDPKLRTQVGIELADVYYQQGELERTASVLHTLLDLNPDNVDILFFAQRVYSELADDTLNKLALLAPGSARMEQLIAERLINAGNLKDATEHYRKALQINPKLPGMHFELAEALMESSPNDASTQREARSELDAAIQVDGDSSKVECEFGRIAFLQSNTDQAFVHYQHAYQLNPKDAQAQIGLAEILKMQNKPEEAATYLRMAIASDPFNAEAHYKLSQVDRQLHLDDEQKKELKLFFDIRATKDKIKLLYRQMNPQATAVGDTLPVVKP
jgi:cytochrome c-type biogenesis protein CcmH/NrfG